MDANTTLQEVVDAVGEALQETEVDLIAENLGGIDDLQVAGYLTDNTGLVIELDGRKFLVTVVEHR